jgi:hypothetical protein
MKDKILKISAPFPNILKSGELDQELKFMELKLFWAGIQEVSLFPMVTKKKELFNGKKRTNKIPVHGTRKGNNRKESRKLQAVRFFLLPVVSSWPKNSL